MRKELVIEISALHDCQELVFNKLVVDSTRQVWPGVAKITTSPWFAPTVIKLTTGGLATRSLTRNSCQGLGVPPMI